MKNEKNKDLLRSSGKTMSGGFLQVIFWISGMIIASMIAQKVASIFEYNTVGMIIGVVIIAIYFVLFYRPFKEFIATPYAAISLLLFIACGTAVGTFVIQNAQPDAYTHRYGNIGAGIIRNLQIQDVFHSFWFVSLFILLGFSLIKSSAKKGFHKLTIPFHLAHLSPIIILFGFWVDFMWGYRGLIDMEIGEVKDQVKVDPNSTTSDDTHRQLDFQIRLDTFQSAKYDPEYRIQLWEKNAMGTIQASPHGAVSNQNPPEIIASFGLEKNKIQKIYGKEIRFWMVDFYPNFEFQYTYPENTETIEPVAPGIMLDLKTGTMETLLQLRTDKPGQNKLTDPSVGTSLEFYWEPTASDLMPLKSQDGMSEDAYRAHSPMGGIGKIVFSGKEKLIYFIKNDEVKEMPMEMDRFYPFFSDESQGFTIEFLFPDSKYLKASPGTRNENLTNPVAEIEVWGNGIEPSAQVFLYPGMQMRGGTYSIPGTQYFLALESVKEKQTKYWKSNLSIIEGENKTVNSSEVIVNRPLNYKGYRFYQTNYDPQNPNYSGIGVSYNPGLNLIYFGFILMVIGIVWMFYFKNIKQTDSDFLIGNKS